MRYLGMLRFRDQDFKHQDDSLDDLINYLENYVVENPGSVIVGIINTESLNIELIGDSFNGKEEYVQSELIDLASNLR